MNNKYKIVETVFHDSRTGRIQSTFQIWERKWLFLWEKKIIHLHELRWPNKPPLDPRSSKRPAPTFFNYQLCKPDNEHFYGILSDYFVFFSLKDAETYLDNISEVIYKGYAIIGTRIWATNSLSSGYKTLYFLLGIEFTHGYQMQSEDIDDIKRYIDSLPKQCGKNTTWLWTC